VALDPGTRLGPYEVGDQIGTGGMGEVYRATDTNLKRQVAIKVLPEAVAEDTERLARFQREAEVLAALNHPNIAAIHGLEKSGGQTALVMELVEGPTLADRLSAQGSGLPVEEALAIAKQIAEALEAAHERGIIHRDLKPANVKVRPDGTVKVLDFGLAKALGPDAASAAGAQTMSPTITTPAMTQVGLILGTAAYMSPEQARGKTVDTRADIWAFGTLLFEMLSGRRAFDGEDTTEVLGAVVRLEPNWDQLPADVPPRVRQVLRACLRKNLKQRLAHIQDVRLILDGAFHEATEAASGAQTAQRPASPWWRRALPLAATALMAGAVAGGAAWIERAPKPGAVVRSVHRLPQGGGFFNNGQRVVAISPDGRRFAYNSSGGGLYVRDLDVLEERPVAGANDKLFVGSPFFSPDGESLGFFSQVGRDVLRLAISGGTAQSLAKVNGVTLFGASWETDGTILYAQADGIWQVSEDGGEPRHLITTKTGEQAFAPHPLPHGDWVLFTLNSTGGKWDEADVVVQSPSSGERKLIRSGGRDARYLPTGHLVFAQGVALYAMPFDLDRLAVTGAPVEVLSGVRSPAGQTSAAAHYDVSTNGTLVYVPGPTSGGLLSRLAWVDATGHRQLVDVPPGDYAHPRLSLDGKRLAFERLDGGTSNIWVYDVSGRAAERRLTEGGSNRYPVWSRDGQYLVYQSDREGDLGVFRQRADGTGGAERLTMPEKGTEHIPERWSPTEDRLAVSVQLPDHVELWMWTAQDGKFERFGTLRSTSPFDVVFSPDGKQIAYTERVTGASSYIQPVASVGTRYQIGRGEEIAHHPLWSHDGRRLFYFPSAGAAVSVAVLRTTPGVELGRPEPFLGDGLPLNVTPTSLLNHDVGPDGRFVTVLQGAEQSGEPFPNEVIIVENWFEELKRLVPTK